MTAKIACTLSYEVPTVTYGIIFGVGGENKVKVGGGDLGVPAGASLASEPDAVTFRFQGGERIYVFVQGTDGHLHVCFWDGAQWNWHDFGRPTTDGHDLPAQSGGGDATVASAASTVSFTYVEPSGTTDRLFAFVIASDNRLHQCYWNGVDNWLWNDLGPTP